jgi:phosphate starvation-inducible membrane PsiE
MKDYIALVIKYAENMMKNSYDSGYLWVYVGIATIILLILIFRG